MTVAEGPGELVARGGSREPRRVAVISMHTSPREVPGTADSGGMNVYVLSVARRLAEQGIAVDIFTRRAEPGGHPVEPVGPGMRVINVPAGPPGALPKEDLPGVVPQFVRGVVAHAAIDDAADAHGHGPYDLVHSHYWLSGWVGAKAKQIWGVPHVTSFHTLGRIKNAALPPGDRPEPPVRLAGERRVVAAADRILAPTMEEAADLVGLYGADPDRIRVVVPGLDRALFVPAPKGAARARLGLPGPPTPVLLFVGRLQPLKGPDLAIRVMAAAVARDPKTLRDAILIVVGGPSGLAPSGPGGLSRLAATLGIADRVRFVPPQPHERLADFYSAADVVLMPSHSESFGLVALEAQACGTPVVASAAGGLSRAVAHGESGYVVRGLDPASHAERVVAILRDPSLAARLRAGAVGHAGRFSWESTAQDIERVYQEVTGGRVP
jgi:D-inositol-3-phosphate glycosyltransferase